MQLTQQFRGLDPKPVPPEGSKIIGQHDDGRPIYELVERVVKGKRPKVINGVEQWRKHPTTGEPITQIMEKVYGEKTRVFVLQPCRNGNVLINENFRPNPEDKARADRKQKVQDTMQRIAEAIVDRGIEPEAIVNAIADAPDDVVEYPKHIGGNKWELSDGSEFRGNRANATTAEQALSSEPMDRAA